LAETTWTLNDGPDEFTGMLLTAEAPTCTVLFAVGGGGNPIRHLPLLRVLASRGCTVVAPHFAMMTNPVPRQEELGQRVRRLALAAVAFGEADRPLKGAGHSIGTVALLVLAGAQAWTVNGKLAFAFPRKFAGLALLSPATNFFWHPGALDPVDVPLDVRVGVKDTMTPPREAAFLKQELGARMPVALHLDEDADHFTYMDDLPPHATDTHPGRGAFLAAVAEDMAAFLKQSP
jgi:pimeloyl-ACP methyl ester carboxylesterase